MSPRSRASADSRRSLPERALKWSASNPSRRKLAQRVGRVTSAICLSLVKSEDVSFPDRCGAKSCWLRSEDSALPAIEVSLECLGAVILLLKARCCGGNDRARDLRGLQKGGRECGRDFPSH